MTLSDRLRELGDAGKPGSREVQWSAPRPTGAVDTGPLVARSRATESAAIAPGDPARPRDPLENMKRRTQEALFQRLGSRLYDSKLSERELREVVASELSDVLAEQETPLSDEERGRLVALFTNDVLGYGPIEAFLADPSVTEVMVNGLGPIFIERDGRLERTDVRFLSDDHLRQVIDRIVSAVGRRVDEASPMVDARLADGSRVNAIIPPLAVDGAALTVRKFSQRALSVEDLIGRRSMTPTTARFLDACVRGRLNVLVTGGTGSGKTTLLNVLSSFIPEDQRIVTIEDAVELRLLQEHVIRLESRPANIEGRGQVTIRGLVRNALRMRPDRIIVGEVRSGEALDMLQAMNTGHDGSLCTLHSNTPRDSLSRLETMVLMAGMDLPLRAIREQVASALDLIVHVSRLRDGSRRITNITEVDGMEGDVITLTDLFTFDHLAGVDAEGRALGELHSTGIRPRFTERLAAAGIELPADPQALEPLLAPTAGGRA